MTKSWVLLFALLIPHLTSCAQVEVSFDTDKVAKPRFIFDPSEVPATPLCPLTNLPSYKQNTGVWCWAASAQTVINYLGYPNEFLQWEIVNNTLGVEPAKPPTKPFDCRHALDSYMPSTGEETDPRFIDMRAKCRVRKTPLDALRQNHHSVDGPVPPLNWGGVIDQLCGKHTPYIFVVKFYDDATGQFAGPHSSVVEGAWVTSIGEQLIGFDDHSGDGFMLMKWEAFKDGVEGDFDHETDYINIHRLP